MDQLRLYQIDMKYVRDLHNADDRVESVSPQIGKASRVFVGVVITHNNRKYCIPLSHPKEKHKKMANNAELQKFEVEGKIIGVLNFNLMIPICVTSSISIDSPSTDAPFGYETAIAYSSTSTGVSSSNT